MALVGAMRDGLEQVPDDDGEKERRGAGAAFCRGVNGVP
jgi:hypothetical protein